MSNIFSFALLIFLASSLINVILNTVKSILTVTASKFVASLINAITYGFYAVIIIQMSQFSMAISVIVTIIANLIGVYVAIWILEKFKKDSLWKISVTINEDDYCEISRFLKMFKIGYTASDIMGNTGELSALEIYSYSQRDSIRVKKILSNFENVKYCITEVRNSL